MTYNDLKKVSEIEPSKKNLLIKLSVVLEEMFKLRNKAYYEYEEISCEDAKKTIKHATKIIKNLEW